MKLSKSQGISFFASFILFAAFSVVVFLLKVPHGVMFWLGYLFGVFAMIVLCSSLFFFFTKKIKEEISLNTPVVVATWVYFIVQMYFSGWEIISFPYDYIPALVINLSLGLVFSIIILSLSAYAEKVGKSEQRVSEKVFFIKMLKNEVDEIETDDERLKEKLRSLSEEIRYSDPMSHSKLSEIENRIKTMVDGLAKFINHEKAGLIIDETSKLLKTRNNLCKTLKGVKDTSVVSNDNRGGNKIVIAGIGVALTVIMITLAVCFVIIPENKYKKAKNLFEEEKYEEALGAYTELNGYKDSDEWIAEIENTVKYNEASKFMEEKLYDQAVQAFTELGDYKDSQNRIAEIETILKDEEYDAAEELVRLEKYEEAITAFEKLGDYKDSQNRISEIETAIKDKEFDAAVDLARLEKYEEAIAAFEILGNYRDSDKLKIEVLDDWYQVAEDLFDSGDYEAALEIYNKVNPYKESQNRIEAISNRQAEGDIIYFGMYDGKPIAWRIIEKKNGMIRLLADSIIKSLPITDEVTQVTYENSSLYTWINQDFLSDFSKDNISQMVLSEGARVNLLTQDDVNSLIEGGINLAADSDWWISTESDNGFMFVTSEGALNEEGDLQIREKGVRPVIWISVE